jgi:hypothetical protein
MMNKLRKYRWLVILFVPLIVLIPAAFVFYVVEEFKKSMEEVDEP